RDLARGLVLDPLIDGGEVGARENLGAVFRADGVAKAVRNRRRGIDQHQGVGNPKRGLRIAGIRDAESAVAIGVVRAWLIRGVRGGSLAKSPVELETVRAGRRAGRQQG